MIFHRKSNYNVILADPPWAFNNVKTGGSLKSGSANQYPVLTLDILKSLDIASVATKNCVLFLWSTNAMKPESMELMKSWGFAYKHTITWVKMTKHNKPFYGLGSWFRAQSEFLLLGIKGKVAAFKCQQRNVVFAKHIGHSTKPNEFYDLVESATSKMPDRKMLELFARLKRPGWDVWGLEVQNDVELKFNINWD